MASDQLNRVKDNVALEVQTARLNLLQALEQVKLTGNSLEKAKENETKAVGAVWGGKNVYIGSDRCSNLSGKFAT